jgi:hypothetical protein
VAPLVAGVSFFLVITIIIIVAIIVSNNKFTNPINALINPSNGCNNNTCSTAGYKRPLENPVRRLSNAPSRDIVGLSLHRSEQNMQKMNNDKAFSSANNAAKLKFGHNVYDELTSY